MKRFNITVNGKVYDVQVEEVGASAPAATGGSCCGPAPAAAPAPQAPAPAEAAPAAPAASAERSRRCGDHQCPHAWQHREHARSRPATR